MASTGRGSYIRHAASIRASSFGWRTRTAFVAAALALIIGPDARPSAQAPPVVLKAFWGPGPERRVAAKPPDAALREVGQNTLHEATPIVTRKPGGPTPAATSDLRAARAGAAAKFSLYLPAVRGVDPMVAAGRNFVVVSQQAEMVFLDKNGVRLPEKNGISSHVRVDDVFGAFTEPGGPHDLNKYAGFPGPCDAAAYPDTRGRKFCISEFYDMRVHFDAGADRFVLVAAVRNPVWTEIWRSGWKVYTDGFGACGVYAPPAGDAKALPNPSFCQLARRYQVFAISRTEDPRDGFHIYSMTENNYRDWPWATVNAEGNAFVLGARGIEMDQGPALSVFSLEDLRAGSPQPRYYKYYPKDLDTLSRRVAPIMHHGAGKGLGGRTLALKRTNAHTLEIFALSAPTGHGTAPPIQRTTVTLPSGVSLHDWLGAAVYRNGYLHASWAAKPSAIGEPGVWNLRFPLSVAQGKIVVPPLTASTPGYRYRLVGKEGLASAAFADIAPAMAVSATGDVMTGYIRLLSDSQLQVRYVLWRSGANAPDPSVHVDVETPQKEVEGKIDYAWAVVDPTDDRTFWFAHNYRWSGAGDNTALVRIPPK